jgi:hypothetical protein
MSYLTPLIIELNKLNVTENYELICHEKLEYLCIGVKSNNNTFYFDMPVDISLNKYNIVDEEVKLFDVYHIDEKLTKRLTEFLNSKVEVKSNESSDKIRLESNNDYIELTFSNNDFPKDFMCLTDNYSNQTSTTNKLIHEGNLLTITVLYKVFETSIPCINTETNENYHEVTTRVTAEIALQLSFLDKQIIICTPDLQFLDNGIIEILENTDEIINFAADNKLIKSRSL